MDWGDIAGSSGFQVGYPLLSALLAASGQRGANVAQGLNTGMVIANRYGEQRKADEQNKLLGQSLGSVLRSTTPVSSTQKVAEMGVDPKTASFEMPQPDQNPSAAALPSPVTLQNQTTTTQKPNFSPQAQSLGDALINAKRPDLILPILARQLFKEPEKPTVVGPGHVVLGPDNQPVYTAPNAPVREPTPPRPYFGSQGDKGIDSYYDPKNPEAGPGGWVTTKTPLGAAPARQLSPQDQRLKELQGNLAVARTGEAGAATRTQNARAGEISQRTERLKQITADLKNPSTAKNLDKLTTIASELRRQRKDIADRIDSDSPENVQRLTDLDAVLDDTVKKQAAAVRDRGGTNQVGLPGAQPAAATPPGKPIGKTKDGKTVYQGPDGKKYVAN